MLSEIRAYLSQHGRATLSEIALHLHVSPDTARGALQLWERKGRVCRLASVCGGGCAHGCGGCALNPATELYAWKA